MLLTISTKNCPKINVAISKKFNVCGALDFVVCFERSLPVSVIRPQASFEVNCNSF